MESNELSVYLSDVTYYLSGYLAAITTAGQQTFLEVELSPGTHTLIMEGTIDNVVSELSLSSVVVEMGPCGNESKISKLKNNKSIN